jgi:hypothetical protein
MRRILALMLVSAFAFLAACGDDEGGGDFSDVDADDLLARSADRMEQVDSFHFEVEHENGTTEIVGGIGMERAEGDVQGTERMQLEVEARFAGTNIQTGIVILPGESYLQNPLTGRWQEQEIDISELFDPATGVTGLMRSAGDEVAIVGREEAGGVDSYVLETTVDSGNLQAFVGNAEPGNEVTAQVWIGVEDLLVRRIDVIGPLAPNEDDAILRRLTLSQFDEPVEITAPR